MIEDLPLRDFLTCALQAVPDKRPTLQELANHRFFDAENTSNDGMEIKLTGSFAALVEEQKEEQKKSMCLLRNNSSQSLASNKFSLPKRRADEEFSQMPRIKL